MLLWISLTWMLSDVGEDVASDDADTDHTREVAGMTAAFALQMECVILLQVWNIWGQNHLTHEWISQDVFVVDLWGVTGQLDNL